MKLSRNGWVSQENGLARSNSSDEDIQENSQDNENGYRRQDQKKNNSQSQISSDSRKSKRQRVPGVKVTTTSVTSLHQPTNPQPGNPISNNFIGNNNNLNPPSMNNFAVSLNNMNNPNTDSSRLLQKRPSRSNMQYTKLTIEDPLSPIHGDKPEAITPLEITMLGEFGQTDTGRQYLTTGSLRTGQGQGSEQAQETPRQQISSKNDKNYNVVIPNFGRISPSRRESDVKAIMHSNHSLDLSGENESSLQNIVEKEAAPPKEVKTHKRKSYNIEILPEFQATNEEIARPISPIANDLPIATPNSGTNHKKKTSLQLPKESYQTSRAKEQQIMQDSTPGFKKKNNIVQLMSSNATDSSTDHSQVMELHSAKKLSESEIKYNPPKKTKEGAHVYQQSKKFTIDSQNPPSNFIIPQFSDQEILEAFKTLDMTKKSYITAQDLAFFLNVLEADATDAEIEEMIRMLDYEGTGRVYYEEFAKLATGKGLNPIGQAYPPTTELLMKKKTTEAAKKEEPPVLRDDRVVPGSHASFKGTTTDRPPRERELPSADMMKRPPGPPMNQGNSLRTSQSMGIDCLSSFVTAFKIGPVEFRNLYNSVRSMLGKYSPECKYVEFLTFLGLPKSGDDYSWNLFSQLVAGSKDTATATVDIRSVMIGLSGCINLDNSQRLEAAFDLYDLEGSSLLPIVSILQIFQACLFGEDMSKIEKRVYAVLKKRGIGKDDYLLKDDYIWLASQYPNLFVTN